MKLITVSAAVVHLTMPETGSGMRAASVTTSATCAMVLSLPQSDGGNLRGLFDNTNATPAAARISASRPKIIAASQPATAPSSHSATKAPLNSTLSAMGSSTSPVLRGNTQPPGQVSVQTVGDAGHDDRHQRRVEVAAPEQPEQIRGNGQPRQA